MCAPLFSIIIPTFNGGGKIAVTVASVLSQERELFEFLVVDGGSTDSTIAYLQAQNGALQWLSEPDVGIYDAMNKGIHRSRGEFLYFLGVGDCLRPGLLAAVAARLRARPDLTHDASRSLLLYGDVDSPEFGGRYDGPFDRLKIAVRNISHQAIFYQRSILERLGGFDLHFRICADHALNIRCFGESWVDTVYINTVVADFEGGGLSSTASDAAFLAVWPGLVWKSLGWRAYLLLQWRHFIRPRLSIQYWVYIYWRVLRGLRRLGRSFRSC